MTQGDVDSPNPNPLRTKSPPAFPQVSDGSGWNLLKSFRSLRIPEDNEGNAWCLPVILTDPTYTRPHYPNEVFNVSTGVFEVQKTPDTWITGAANAAGYTGLWTPAAGKRFRLMGGILTVSKDAACAGAEYVELREDTVTRLSVSISGGALTATGNVIVVPFSFPGNGLLQTLAGNLNIWLNGALTTGEVRVTVWGVTEAL